MNIPVTISCDDDVMHVILDGPYKLNSFSAELVADLQSAVDLAAADGVRLLVFKGAGKGFSGGFDLDGLEDLSDGDLLLRFVRVEELLQAVFHASFATLALVHGACYGAAADLVAAYRYRVATPDARFRMPGSSFGVVPGVARLARLVGADAARSLLLRDTAFDSNEALNSGFLCEVSDADGWPAIIEQQLRAARGVNAETYSSMAEAMIDNTQDTDLAVLVRSASCGSIKHRIETYLKQMRAARKS